MKLVSPGYVFSELLELLGGEKNISPSLKVTLYYRRTNWKAIIGMDLS